MASYACVETGHKVAAQLRLRPQLISTGYGLRP